MTKLRSGCGRVLPISIFSFKIKSKGRRQSKCKDCHREYRKIHYQQNRQKYIDKAKRWNDIRTELLHKLLYNYLLAHPCVDCGESDVLVLEFDHHDDCKKVIRVSNMVRSKLHWNTILREIAQCDVRCSNCHRRRHRIKDGDWRTKMRV